MLGDRLDAWTASWWVLVVVGLLTGAGVGVGIRSVLARLRRGAVLRPGGVEIACAVVTAASLAAGWGTARLVILLWAGWLGVALAAVDLRHHRLPDALTLPAWGVSAALVVGTSLWSPGSGSVPRAVLAAALVGGLFWLVWRIAPAAMGRGDVKLVPALVLLTGYLSWGAAVLGVVLAFVTGSVVSLLGLLSRRMTMRSALAFGPHLLAGCWLVLAVPGWSAGG
ncbi:prepilin peptidase [Nakamurella flavida]|uniref:Prepilin peptidase n=1 Tax=Nakamurella flavida TaxID=363630 RepID=A0A939BZS4_9ACTN|nr:A24 family peptidase [Nakamurella flavida]MBM9475993.1 prepilin peptidase [Nakamurella flavida]MDP9777264.1 leader peptidase (prepilin peptidase)/N-methyltransferase [Nakamurella flavida]